MTEAEGRCLVSTTSPGGPGQDVCCHCGTSLFEVAYYGARTGSGTGRDGYFACASCHWKKEAEQYRSKLLNLVAIIHRDGGHYTEVHGETKSFEDARERAAAAVQQLNKW